VRREGSEVLSLSCRRVAQDSDGTAAINASFWVAQRFTAAITTFF